MSNRCTKKKLVWNFRSSRLEAFYRKGVLRNFAKFTGKHLCQSLFFNKAASPRLVTLLKKRLWHRSFPVNFAEFLRTSFLQNTSGGCFSNRSGKHSPRRIIFYSATLQRLHSTTNVASLQILKHTSTNWVIFALDGLSMIKNLISLYSTKQCPKFGSILLLGGIFLIGAKRLVKFNYDFCFFFN